MNRLQRKNIGRYLIYSLTSLIIFLLVACDVLNPGLGDMVDLSAPTVEVNSHINGDYVGGSITLSGEAIDDIGVTSVTISSDKESVNATIDGQNWTALIDTSILDDGDNDFTITVTDSSGKSVSISLLLIVDNNAPTVLVTTPDSYGHDIEFNKNMSIKGEATDSTRVSKVLISLYDNNGNALFTDKQATGTSSWYYIFDTEDYVDPETFSDPGNLSTYYFDVKAVDNSGNFNSWFYHFQDFLNSIDDPTEIPSIEEIHKVDFEGETFPANLFNSNITLKDLRRTTDSGRWMEIDINPDSDAPQFTFISPADPDENENIPTTLGSPQKMSGIVEDDDGIKDKRVDIAIWKEADYLSNDDTNAVVQWTTLSLSGNQWNFTPSTDLAEEESFILKLRAWDIYSLDFNPDNATYSKTIEFNTTSALPPVISITSPDQGSYIGSNSIVNIELSVDRLTSEGVVKLDPNGDGDFTTDQIFFTNPSADGMTWTLSIDPGTDFTLLEGPQIFQIRAGTATNYSTTSLQYTGDATIPQVSIEYPEEGQNVNGIINVLGTSSDNNIIDSITLELDGSSQTISGGTKYNWISQLDTNSLTSGSHILSLTAADGAGNVSTSVSVNFNVDQESDRPIISFSNLVEGGISLDNGLGQDSSIIGSIEDDDNVDVSTIEIKIDIYNDDLEINAINPIDLNSDGDTNDINESGDWQLISSPPGSDGRIVNWTHSLQNLPQGEHSMQLRVHDTNSSGTADEGTNPNFALTALTEFMIDYGPPDLIISQPANNSLFNTTFAISGTASDANGVSDVEISFDGGTNFTSIMDVADSGNVAVAWSYDFTVDGSNDGDYSYQIRATDMSGGKTTLDRQVIVDATSPTLVIEQPASASSVNGSSVSIRGTADDNRDVTAVYIDINPDGGSTPEVDPTLWDYTATGTYSWSQIFDSLALVPTDTATDYVITVLAEDSAGNDSAQYTTTISIDQGSDRPVITFNDIDKDETVAANNVLVGATTLTGIIEDDDLMDPALFSGESIEIDIDGGGWQAVSAPPAASGKVVVWKHSISSLTEGLHYVKLRARDNQSDGTVGASSAAAEYSSNFNWNIEDSADQNGIPFILNLGPPTITISNPAPFSYHNTDVVISGSAVDANQVASMEISFDNGTTWTTIPITAGTTVNWTYTVLQSSGDDTYSYLIKATDAYGSTGIESSQFTLDTTEPSASVDRPSDGATVNGDLTISGTASDNTSLSSVYYNVDLASAGPPTFPDDYTLFSGGQTYSWNTVLDTTDTGIFTNGDDTYTLRIVPLDTAGNAGETSIASVDFTVDQNSDKPVISFSSITAGGSFTDNLLPASKQVTGSIIDDDGVDVSSIQYTLYNEDLSSMLTDWTSISGAPGSDTTLATWSHTFTESDGKYQMALRAADIYDGPSFTPGDFSWDDTTYVKFAIDTANPVTTITSPATNGGYTNQDFTVAGTASDLGGISNIKIQFNSEGEITLYSDLSEPYSTSVPWTTSYNVNEITHANDGILNYTVTVTDSYGKQSTYERYINVDTVDPYINSLTLVNNDQTGGGYVNGSVLIQGTPGDDETLVNAIYLMNATAAPAEPGSDPTSDGWELLSSTTSISYRFDSSDLTDSTDYSTYLLLEDLAGNRTAVGDYTLGFHTEQSGNTPVITLNTSDGALLWNSDSISGSITDDDSVDVSTIQISFDGGTNWVPVSSASASDSTNVVFSHSLASVAEQAAAYSVKVRTSDTGEDFTDDTQDIPAVSTETATISVYVDNSAPTAGITLLDNGKTSSASLQGIYINDQFTLTGTSSDGVGIAEVRAKLATDAGDPAAVTNTGTAYDTWSYSRAGLSIGADSVGLVVEVEDVHGRTTTYNYTLLVDETKPTVSFITPTGTYYGSQEFRGTASDNVKVDYVYLAHGDTLPSAPAGGDPASDPAYTQLGSTYSWNTILDTLSIQDGLGIADADKDSDLTYYISVVSIDGAGNLSDKTDMLFTINQGDDRPTYSFTNISEGAAASVNLLESNAKILAYSDDDDGLSSIEIFTSDTDNSATWDTDGFDTDTLTWNAITTDGTTPFTVSGLSQNWQSYVADLGEGVHYAKFRIKDTNYTDSASTPFNYIVTPTVAFTIDTGAPSVAITDFDIDGGGNKAAAAGLLINNSFTINGTATDGNTISSIQIKTDNALFDTYIDVDTPGTSWSHVISFFPLDGSQDGSMTIYVTATDQFAKSTTISLPINIDTLAPVISATQPSGMTSADPPNVNGSVTLRGTITEVSGISSFSAIGGVSDDVVFTNSGSDLNWVLDVDSDLYASAAYSVDQGSNIWRFPIDLTAEDSAGNIGANTFQIDIDPDSDKPILYLSTPSDDSSVAGAFIVQGTATDDDDIQTLTMQVDINYDGDYNDTYDLDGDSTAGNSDFEDEATPVDITVSNGTWSILMNQDSEFSLSNLTAIGVPAGGDTDIGTSGADGWIRLLMTPYDVNGLAGNPVEIRVYIDSTAPIIEGQGQALPDPANGSIVNGTVNLAARFKDDKALELSKMQISYDGGVSYQTISAAGGTVTDNGVVSGYYEYDIDLPIDTTDTGGIVSGGNGLLQLVLKVTDETYKQNSQSIQLNVDNTLPTGIWNYNSDLTDQAGVYTFSGNATNGGDYLLIGSAEDSGTISGVEKVDVFFVKDGNFYNPTDGSTVTTTGNTSTVADMTGTDQSIPYPPAISYDDLVISIDNRSERGIYDTDPTDGDQDGFEESLRSKGTYEEWFVYFDTEVFPDGPMDLYYVVYDTAGNMSYELVSSQISNNPPNIDSFDIGGTNYTADSIYLKVSGDVSFAMNVDDAEGIDATSYVLTIANEYAIGGDGYPGTENTSFTPIVYADLDFTTQTSSQATVTLETVPLGLNNIWYRLEAQVQDSHSNIVTKDFYLLIDNNDSTGPIVTIDDFTQTHNVDGHIEEADNSPDSDNQADISGTVNITGTARDGNSVNSVGIYLSQDGGTSFTYLGDAVLTSDSNGDPLDGEEYVWTYDWDSSSITGVADEDVVILPIGYDGTNYTYTDTLSDGYDDSDVDIGSIDATAFKEVDVVPYVSEIQTGLDNALLKPARRSVRGWYPVRTDQSITVIGYNLPVTGSGSVTVGGTSLTHSGSDNQTLTMTLPSTDSSGNLIVTTNSVLSRNHLNTNTLTQNQEDNAYNDSLTDDRYLAFFTLNTTTYTGIDAVMRASQPSGTRDGTFDWFYVQNNVDVLYNANKLAYSFKVNGGDFTFNESGTPVYLFLNDSNSVDDITDRQYYFYGSVLWGLGNTAYGAATSGYYAMNWNVDDYPTLGVGNLSFNTGTNYTSTTYTDSYKMSRYDNLRILTSGDDTDMTNYVFYFDNHPDTRSIVYYTYKTGTTATIGTAMGSYDGSTWYRELDENNVQDTVFKYNNGGNDTGIETPEGRYNLTSGSNDSEYFAPYLDSSGTMHLVYWDETNNLLYYTYNDTPYADPNTGNVVTPGTGTSIGWTTPLEIDSNAGQYPDIVVDDTGKVHIVYQDSANSTLKYAYLTSKTDTTVEKFHVDGLFGAGSWNSISLKEDFDLNSDGDYTDSGESQNVQRPVITTYAGGLSGTNYAVKMAFPLADPGSVTDGFSPTSFTYSGTWEVMVVPSTVRPTANKTFAETNGTVYGAGNMVAGYNGSTLQSAVFRAID